MLMFTFFHLQNMENCDNPQNVQNIEKGDNSENPIDNSNTDICGYRIRNSEDRMRCTMKLGVSEIKNEIQGGVMQNYFLAALVVVMPILRDIFYRYVPHRQNHRNNNQNNNRDSNHK